MSSLELIRQQEAQLLVSTYDRVPVLFERGQGVHLFDCDGRRYVDFLSGIGVNALGHGHPAIQAAITEQAGRLIHVSNLFYHEHQARLAAKLAASRTGGDELSGMSKKQTPPPAATARDPEAIPSQSVRPGSLK